MRTFYIPLLMLFMIAACNHRPQTAIPEWIPYDESEEIAANADHESVRMRFKLIQSRVLDKNELWKVVEPQLGDFTEEVYEKLKPSLPCSRISAQESLRMSNSRNGTYTES